MKDNKQQTDKNNTDAVYVESSLTVRNPLFVME